MEIHSLTNIWDVNVLYEPFSSVAVILTIICRLMLISFKSPLSCHISYKMCYIIVFSETVNPPKTNKSITRSYKLWLLNFCIVFRYHQNRSFLLCCDDLVCPVLQTSVSSCLVLFYSCCCSVCVSFSLRRIKPRHTSVVSHTNKASLFHQETMSQTLTEVDSPTSVCPFDKILNNKEFPSQWH